MSIILDALRKSEHQRQRNASPDLAGHVVKPKTSRRTPWLAIILVLLGLNGVLLATLWLRTSDTPETTAVTNEPAATRVRPAPYREPSREIAVSPPPTVASDAIAAIETAEPVTPPARSDSDDAGLPSLETMQLQGLVNLPPMRIDLHVYSDAPAERFVFINMKKHTEGSALQEGAVVEEITPDGVILYANGQRFIMSKN